jgi:hypothetical protein
MLSKTSGEYTKEISRMISSSLQFLECYSLIIPPIRLVNPFIRKIIPASPVARIPIFLRTSFFRILPANGNGKNQIDDPMKNARKAI